jgi:hypothetical protein
LLIDTRRSVPTGVPAGPRIRLASRRKNGALDTSRIVTFETVTSSSAAPSTVSSARPRERVNTMFEIVMFLNPPFDSVPSLMRPVGPSRSGAATEVRPYVPSSTVPTSKPLTMLFVIVTFSVTRGAPSA